MGFTGGARAAGHGWRREEAVKNWVSAAFLFASAGFLPFLV
jgi:hypothetical protein